MKAVGIDIGGSKLMVGVSDNNRQNIHTEETGQTNSEFKKQLETILKQNQDVSATCIASAGTIDMKKGIILKSPNTRIRNFNVRELFEKHHKRLYLVNDCVAALVGEKCFGDANTENFIYLTISTGIGAGIFVDGRILFGKDGNAHEVGHTVLDMEERMKCGCGKRGHWEAYCSGTGIPVFASYLMKQAGFNRNIKNAKEFFELAKKEKPAKDALEIIAKINAMGIANLINCYDPELIVLGGPVALKNPDYIQKSQKHIKNYLINRMPEMRFTKLKDGNVIQGALALAQGRFKI